MRKKSQVLSRNKKTRRPSVGRPNRRKPVERERRNLKNELKNKRKNQVRATQYVRLVTMLIKFVVGVEFNFFFFKPNPVRSSKSIEVVQNTKLGYR